MGIDEHAKQETGLARIVRRQRLAQRELERHLARIDAEEEVEHLWHTAAADARIHLDDLQALAVPLTFHVNERVVDAELRHRVLEDAMYPHFLLTGHERRGAQVRRLEVNAAFAAEL